MDFESLANELFLELFDYFDGSDLLYTFYGLNSRFNDLLYKQYRAFRFNFKSISKQKFDFICQQHLPFITDHVISLVLSNGDDTPEQIDLFLSYIPSIQQFTHLRSLSVYKLYTYEAIMKIIDQCHQLDYFTHFKFDYSYLSTDRIEYQSMIDNIWTLPKLIHCGTNVTSNIFEANYRTPTKISSSLRSLSLSGEQIKLNQINELFQCTPRLKHLSTGITDSDNDYLLCLFPTLTKLKIFVMNISNISKIISLLQNMPNLYHLDIDLFNKTITGNQWEKLINNHLSKLKIFHLKMTDYVRSNESLDKRPNELISSFRSPFWTDKHRWFIRCFVCEPAVYLCTTSSKLPTHSKKFPDLFMSTDPNDNLQNFCNDIIGIRESTFFDYSIPSSIHLTNIKQLELKLPANNQFWSIVPNLNQLYSLAVHANTTTSQIQLQVLLDRAPHLYQLYIYNNRLSGLQRLQMELLQCTHTSLRELDLEQFGHSFDEQECVALIHSPLPAQCEVLSISVTSCESILNLVYNMKNLRALNVQCTGAVQSNHLLLEETGSQHRNKNLIGVDRIIQWLKERLPSTYSIGIASEYRDNIQIWM